MMSDEQQAVTISNRWWQGETVVSGRVGRTVSDWGKAGERLPFMGNGESDCHKRAMRILPIKGKWIAFKGRPNPNGNLGGRRVGSPPRHRNRHLATGMPLNYLARI